MTTVLNATISRADIRFYPEAMLNQIELLLQFERGGALFLMQDTSDNMLGLYHLFNTESINELPGKFCRAVFDEHGNLQSIKNIVYDDNCELYNDPAL